MSDLRISKDLVLPPETDVEALAILAMRGAGKSNTAVVIAEEMYAAGTPWVAIDPKGDWWGVRAAGTKPGLPIPVLGGDSPDAIAIHAQAGGFVADLIVEKNLTCVVDVSDFSKGEQTRFLADFAERLYTRVRRRPVEERTPLHLFLEEADEYIPQMVRGETARVVGAFERIVKRGRVFGLGCTLITQRSASLNKDVLTQVGTLIVLRTPSPQDRKAVLAWVEQHDVPADLVSSLPQLENGEAWIWSPQFLKTLERVQIRRRHTFDAGATPRRGDKRRPIATLADIDVAELKEQMADVEQKARADDPRELRRQIATLEKQIRAQATPPATSTVDRVQDKESRRLVARLRKAVEAAMKFIVQVNVHELQTELTDRAALQKAIENAVLSATKVLDGKLEDQRRRFERLTRDGQRALHELEQLAGGDVAVQVDIRTQDRFAVEPEPVRVQRVAPTPRTPTPLNGSLGRSQQAVLDALAWFEAVGITPVKRPALAFIAGTRPTSGGFKNNLGALRSNGMLDYPAGNCVQLTESGRATANPPDAMPTVDVLQEQVLARLTGSQAKLLRVLIGRYPDPIHRDVLAAEAGVPATSGGFKNNLGAMRTLELLDYPEAGLVVALPVLFLEGE